MARFILAASVFLLLLLPEVSSGLELLLDEESRECVTCHEDEVAVREFRICHGDVCDHPIGIDYAGAAVKNAGLVSPGSVNPAVLLPGGRITCASCHTRYKKDEHEATAAMRDGSQPDPMLSMDNTGSALCAACHNK
ncbi:MAG: hypothetical protein A2054_11010 [Deltaproteobacteria bacterium GWA2_55_10]|nr:MAG: hypothetical protein A2054_11010 [Deltaproteobacteria bacterium GWA2_55_10]